MALHQQTESSVAVRIENRNLYSQSSVPLHNYQSLPFNFGSYGNFGNPQFSFGCGSLMLLCVPRLPESGWSVGFLSTRNRWPLQSEADKITLAGTCPFGHESHSMGQETSGKHISYKDKWRPIIRMGITLPQLQHGQSQRQSTIRTLQESAVERLHELRGAAVIHVPQGKQQGPGPRSEQ